MKERTDSSFCWFIIIITTTLLSNINGMEQISSNDNRKESISSIQSNPVQNDLTQSQTNVNKRASFMPSRGKKEESDDFGIDKKASGFLPMRGRKDDYQQQYGWNPNQFGYFNSMSDDKRAGFMPMRGRKNDGSDMYGSVPEDVYQSELDSAKRSSFMPMRGRKDDVNSAVNYGQVQYPMSAPYFSSYQMGRQNWIEGQHNNDDSPVMDKKANSFFGARGKRSVDTAVPAVNHVINQKRSINSGQQFGHNENFFATRG